MVSRTIASRVASLAARLALLLPICAAAQSALLSELHTIATPDTGVPVEHTFTISNAGTYKVTLTDLGAAMTPPAPLSSAKMAVTQGSSIVGTPAVLASGSSTASLTLQATANTTYTLRVVGAPAVGLNSGVIGEAVTAADGSSVASYADTLALPVPAVANGESIVNDTFSVTSANAGSYTISVTDLKLPKALKTLILALVPTGGSAPVATLPVPGTNAMQTTVSLAAGTYQLVAIGKTDSTDPTAVGGLFTVSVVGASGPATFYPAKTVTVGAVAQVQSAALPPGSYSMQLADLAFPNALATLGAALVRDDGVVVAGPLAPGGNSSFTVASAGNKYLAFAVATPQAGGLGSYSLQVQPSATGTAAPINVARLVGTPSTATVTNPSPFSYDTTIPGAGSYTVTLTDFSFPGPLTSTRMAAVQGGKVVATLAGNTGSFTVPALQGPLTLLAYTQATAAGGVFGIDVSPGTGAAVFDTTQPVGLAFAHRPLAIASSGSYDVSAVDVGFPASFSSFYVLAATGTQVAGKIIGGGKFSFNATPGTYFVDFLAIASGADKAGTYSLAVAPTPPAPTLTLSSSATHVAGGGTVTLTWSSQNAKSCSASGGWSGTQATSGTATSTALTSATTFTLSCSGDGGTASQSVSVTIDSSASSGGGGGGAFGLLTLLGLAGCLLVRGVPDPRRQVPQGAA